MRRLSLILLSIVALVNISCERRELVELSNTHYVRVYINEDIKNVTMGFYNEENTRPKYSSPDILRLILSDPQTGKARAERFLRTKGEDERGTYYEGYIVADPGMYNLIAYNFDTEVCIVRNYNDYNNAKVYTNEIATHLKTRVSKNALKAIRKEMQKAMQKVAPGVTKSSEEYEKIVYDPDHFFLANCGNVYIPYSDELDTLRTPDMDYFVAESIVKSYYVQVKVKNIEYATSSLGLVSGMAGSAWLGLQEIDETDPATMYLELQPGEDNAAGLVKGEEPAEAVMYTTFNTFGKLLDADSRFAITFDFLTTHGGSYTTTLDITDYFSTPEAVDHQWLLIDEVIELPEPQPGTGGGGGFQPTVGEWEDVNTEIII